MMAAKGAHLLVGDGLAAQALTAASEMVPLMVLTGRMWRQLAAELGGEDVAAEWLLALAERRNRPIAVNFADGPERSQTCSIAPRAWTEERLKGWIGGFGAELVEMFGAVERPPYRSDSNAEAANNRAERRRRARRG
jgi:hypothetical protein